MPAAAAALAPLVPLFEAIAAGTAVAGTGIGLYEQQQQAKAQAAYLQQQQAGAQQQQQQQQQAESKLTAQTQAQNQAAVARQFPNVQEQIGGATAPDYQIQIAQQAAGVDPSQLNLGTHAFSQWLGDRNLTSVQTLGAAQPGYFDTLQPGQGPQQPQVTGAG